jgi:hypothetical protein
MGKAQNPSNSDYAVQLKILKYEKYLQMLKIKRYKTLCVREIPILGILPPEIMEANM